jgi:hypothetical protein
MSHEEQDEGIVASEAQTPSDEDANASELDAAAAALEEDSKIHEPALAEDPKQADATPAEQDEDHVASEEQTPSAENASETEATKALEFASSSPLSHRNGSGFPRSPPPTRFTSFAQLNNAVQWFSSPSPFDSPPAQVVDGLFRGRLVYTQPCRQLFRFREE